MHALILLVACATLDEGTDSASSQDDPVVDDGFQRPAPEWTADDVATALDLALGEGFFDPFAPRDLYLELLDNADESCPVGAEDGDITASFSGCVTDTYWLFAGIATYEEETTNQSASFSLSADCYVMDPDRNVYAAAGQIGWSITEDGSGQTSWESTVVGTWSYPLADGWVSGPGSVAVWSWGQESADGMAMGMTGSMRWSHELYVEDLVFDSTCGAQPAGQVRIRGDDGYWYTVDLAADCSGCGDVRFVEDTVLGQACIDASSALTSLTDRIAAGGGL